MCIRDRDKAAAKHAKAEKNAKAEQPAADAASTNGTPATTEQVLTETWSYQLPADE